MGETEVNIITDTTWLPEEGSARNVCMCCGLLAVKENVANYKYFSILPNQNLSVERFCIFLVLMQKLWRDLIATVSRAFQTTLCSRV